MASGHDARSRKLLSKRQVNVVDLVTLAKESHWFQNGVVTVAADGTAAPSQFEPPPVRPTISLQRPTSEHPKLFARNRKRQLHAQLMLHLAGGEIYYDAQEELSDFGKSIEHKKHVFVCRDRQSLATTEPVCLPVTSMRAHMSCMLM